MTFPAPGSLPVTTRGKLAILYRSAGWLGTSIDCRHSVIAAANRPCKFGWHFFSLIAAVWVSEAPYPNRRSAEDHRLSDSTQYDCRCGSEELAMWRSQTNVDGATCDLKPTIAIGDCGGEFIVSMANESYAAPNSNGPGNAIRNRESPTEKFDGLYDEGSATVPDRFEEAIDCRPASLQLLSVPQVKSNHDWTEAIDAVFESIGQDFLLPHVSCLH
jgi:hypothetical protein